MIVAKMATFPPREENLIRVIKSLYQQVDLITVYCNEYLQCPSVLGSFPNVTCYLGDDLGDGGKIYGTIGDLTFLVDDDILYPTNYVERMSQELDFHGGKAIVGCHAAIMRNPIKNYYRDRHVLHFRQKLSVSTPVNVLGTGTLAFKSDYFDVSSIFPMHNNMLDNYVAVAAQEQEKKMISIRRPPEWLKSIESKESLWSARGAGAVQTQVMTQVRQWKTY